MELSSIISPALKLDVAKAGTVAASAAGVIGLTLVLTYVFTYLRYRIALARELAVLAELDSAASDGETKKKGEKITFRPSHLPYALPWLGSALSFLTDKTGSFWERVMATHPLRIGALRVMQGGMTNVVVFSPPAVAALFKTRQVNKDMFKETVLKNGFGMSLDQWNHYIDDNIPPESIPEEVRERALRYKDERELTANFLQKQENVNELVSYFIGVMNSMLADDEEEKGDGIEVELGMYMQRLLFHCTVKSLMGTRIFEVVPDLFSIFYTFDRLMPQMFFGFPRIFYPKGYNSRDRILRGLEAWHESVLAENKGVPADPEEVRWEPLYGSRMNRARQYMYMAHNLTVPGRSNIDLGFLFGMGSNVVPGGTWMLMRILDPRDPTVRRDVMAELATAIDPDGKLDIPTLANLPLLSSIYQEVLRFYIDGLLTRELTADVQLPIDGQRSVQLKKGDIALAPTWICHRAEDGRWTGKPANEFDARRFLVQDPETGKAVYSVAGHTGNVFPYGGGKSICPGRQFAKLEMLVSAATMLLRYDIKVLGFTDKNGKETEEFPPIGKSYPGAGVASIQGGMKIALKRRHGDQKLL